MSSVEVEKAKQELGRFKLEVGKAIRVLHPILETSQENAFMEESNSITLEQQCADLEKQFLERILQLSTELERQHGLNESLLIQLGVITEQLSDITNYLSEKERYHFYLLSPEWQAKANTVKLAAGGKCQLCNSSVKLNVHHRTYENLFNEPMSDLICLCEKCHHQFHRVRKNIRQIKKDSP